MDLIYILLIIIIVILLVVVLSYYMKNRNEQNQLARIQEGVRRIFGE